MISVHKKKQFSSFLHFFNFNLEVLQDTSLQMPTLTLMEKSTIPNVFKLELTPPKPIINPDEPFSMTVKNMSEKIQAVEVEVESYLFELMDARAKVWPYYQVYHKLEPGGTLSFKIGVMKETPEEKRKFKDCDGWQVKKPEGLLKVYHTVTGSMDDTDEAWGFQEEDIETYYVMPGRRVLDLQENRIAEHGHVEMELICEKETKLIKKRRKRFERKMSGQRSSGCSIM
ncbi:unnamed protein product [Caenorhabditis brenneri]